MKQRDISFLDLKSVTELHGDEIRSAINKVVDSGWYLHGECTRQFEEDFAKYIGTKYCIGVGNGLEALSLILRAYKELGKLKDGDEVIVPANTFIASVLAITENNLIPVFAEPRLDTLVIDDSAVEALITERTRAIMIVHLYGRCSYTTRIGELCNKHNLLLIEDNAQAHGCRSNSSSHRSISENDSSFFIPHSSFPRTGSLGHAAGHSFYPGKNLGAMGDGGAVTTDDLELAEAIRSLGNYGSSAKYVYKYKGENSRLDELQAAVLDVKLRHLDEDNARRQQIAAHYYDNISNPHVTLPVRLPDANNVYHIFPVLCEERDKLQSFLKERGIQTLIHYPVAPHQQECYKEYSHLSLPVTERIHREELSLPMSPSLTIDDAKYVAECINEFML
ncbi:MAG: DegT/DnrJ/EryC1/StrS family aminotransferase [Bacteroidaceae bacterium]|nr:DegT/DnrJ/EryC1/StrS family aminotransferase [Bacteroidaceae bacterium]